MSIPSITSGFNTILQNLDQLNNQLGTLSSAEGLEKVKVISQNFRQIILSNPKDRVLSMEEMFEMQKTANQIYFTEEMWKEVDKPIIQNLISKILTEKKEKEKK